MPQFIVEKATKTQAKGRVAIEGPAGSGKTYTALIIAEQLCEGGRIIYIDSENRSSEKYADIFDFDILPLEPPYSVKKYTDAIKFASGLDGYDVIAVDSLSHAWAGEGGALEQVDSAKAKYQGNSYVAWREVTPSQWKMVEAILSSPKHVIACMRTKTEYAMEKDQSGRTTIKKLGMAPVQREGLDYEFDIVFAMDWDHNAIVTKTRMASMADQVINRPDASVGQAIKEWLSSGEARPEEPVIVQEEIELDPDAIVAALEEQKRQSDLVALSRQSYGLEEQKRQYTQSDLVGLARQSYGYDGKAVGAALKAAGFGTFDAENWDEMVAAIKAYHDAEEEAEEENLLEMGDEH